MITTTNKQKGNNTMNDLNRILNRLTHFDVIDATDNKAVFETPEGNVTASYRIDTLRGDDFPLQVVLHIANKGLNVYTWGSMSNEDNATIINFFRLTNENFILAKHEEEEQTKKDMRLLLNL
tara:strand:+ start:155 stop:520 length:366 start_codon:yes stop_codon:yes gene_type:complete